MNISDKQPSFFKALHNAFVGIFKWNMIHMQLIYKLFIDFVLLKLEKKKQRSGGDLKNERIEKKIMSYKDAISERKRLITNTFSTAKFVLLPLARRTSHALKTRQHPLPSRLALVSLSSRLPRETIFPPAKRDNLPAYLVR